MKSVLAFLVLASLASCASPQPRTRAEFVGHWRYADENQSCDYSFKNDGSFTGEVKQKTKVVSRFTGRWDVQKDALLYTYLSDVYGRIPAGATDRDELLEVKTDSFLIRA